MWWLAVLFLGTVLFIGLSDMRKPKKFPPGPMWWPCLGSTPQVQAAVKRTGHLLLATAEFSKQYGSILGLKVGKEKVVVIHGLQANKEFLSNDALSGRPLGDSFNLRSWGRRLGILLVDEEPWQEQRRFFLKNLREFGFGTRNMSKLVEEEADELVKFIFRKIGRNGQVVLNIRTLFNVHVLNTLWKMLAGVRFDSDDEKMIALQSMLSDLFNNLSMVGATFSHFPVLKYLAPEYSGYSMYIRTHERIWEFLYKELDYHKKTHNPEEPRDVMDIYLNVLSSDKVPPTFSEEQLIISCMDMFMAGSETTSNTLSFGFLYLILDPEIQRKAQEEIDSVIGNDRSPSLDDRPKMPYVECIVMESLRMFGGRAFTVPHRALRDTYIDGYLIPKDVLVVGNLYGCMLEEGCGLDEPKVFKPERYLKNGKICLPDNLIAFGMGKHRCLGETLARANLFLFTASLLQNFSFSVVPEEPPNIDWEESVTPAPKRFKTLISPRQ